MDTKDNQYSSSVEHGECIPDEMLLRYLEQKTSSEETRQVQAHLSQCPVCFEIVVSTMDVEIYPFTKEEIEAVDAIVDANDEKNFKKIFGHQLRPRQITPTPARPSTGFGQRFLDWISPQPAWRLGVAAVGIAVVLLIAGKLCLQYYSTEYKLNQAEVALQQHFDESAGSLWMASNNGKLFNFSGATTMGADEIPTFIQEAKKKISEAIQNGASSEKTLTILTEIYLIELNYTNDYTALDSLVRRIDPGTLKSAALLNNLGIYYFRIGDWQTAGDYFQHALTANPNLLVAKFNLAKAYIEMGKAETAIPLLQEYAIAESDDTGRQREALDLIDTLQRPND